MYQFRLFSKNCEYAIWSIGHMAAAKTQKMFLAKNICRKLKIPEFYTRKGLQALARSGILESVSGPGGGYALAKGVGNLSILKIIQYVDGKDTFNHCMMGLSNCGEKNPCEIHEVWAKAKEGLLRDLDSVSLNDLNSRGKCREKNRIVGKYNLAPKS